MGPSPRLPTLLALLALLAPFSRAGTVTVAPGQSIQAAIDQAADGDVIVVAKGTYDEAVAVVGRSDLRLRCKGPVVLSPPAGEGAAVGLTIQGSTGIEVFRLGLADSASHGIHVVASTDVTLNRCRISGAGGDGVRVDDSQRVAVERCRIEDVAGHGVALSAGLALERTDVSSVARNRILRPGLDGVAVNGDDNRVERNRIEAAGDDGVELAEGGEEITGNVVSRNRIFAPVDTGLTTWGTANLLELNRVFDAGQTGGRLRGMGNRFERNRFVRVLAGVGVDAKDPPEIEGEFVGHRAIRNVVVESALDGFLMIIGGSHFERNVARACGTNGFTVVDMHNVLLQNRATRAVFVGFKIFGDGFHVVDGNRAVRNEVAGFLVTSSHCLFQNNRATRNQLFDLSDEGINCYADGNKFKIVSPDPLLSDCSDWF